MSRYRLFSEGASFYDLHTPAHHYQHDHQFVIDELTRRSPGKQILDVGCGTGIFLEKATLHGFEPFGLDISPQMVEVAARRLGCPVSCMPMQDLEEVERYDGVVSLSWSFNYCDSLQEARHLLQRFFRALRSGGTLILQIAHAPNTSGVLMEDQEPGPDGTKDDISFFYRFSKIEDAEPILQAEYAYVCRSRNELLFETHTLHAADANLLAEAAQEQGFVEVSTFDTFQGGFLQNSLSPFIIANKP